MLPFQHACSHSHAPLPAELLPARPPRLPSDSLGQCPHTHVCLKVVKELKLCPQVLFAFSGQFQTLKADQTGAHRRPQKQALHRTTPYFL